jgi:DNA-binding protein H-NS
VNHNSHIHCDQNVFTCHTYRLTTLSLEGKIMATYSELVQQITDLQKQAERQRKEEYSSVVKTIKKQIAEYGITAEELGLGSAKPMAKRGRKATAKAGKAGRKPRAKRSTAGVKVAPKYRDAATGNTWTGRGKMPRWLAEATAGGRALQSFLIPAAA